ncbi:hypothetical protein AN958_06546 [Leucoagaricus sp. SymC.cos]|nr:hypothetical protein AN958_06546 [Leucoagaricus sp. SymC.cos]
MVSTPSAAAQAIELEKKRKQTLERAKANHLSRQLQMRLQYARLKVEHGWQRQNLNEVENLYFHHSHQRGPRPFTPSSAFTTGQADHAITLTLPSRYSDSTYKPLLSTLSRSSTVDTLIDNLSQENNSATGNAASGPSTPALPPSQVPVSSNNTPRTSSTPPVLTEPQIFQPPQPLMTPAQTPAPDPQISSSLPAQNIAYISISSHSAATSVPENASLTVPATTQQAQLTTSPAFTGRTSPYAPTTLTPTQITTSSTKKPSVGNIANASSTSRDVFGLGTASLTYDSFWSGLQSKSYPAFKSSGQASVGPAVTGAVVNGTSGATVGVLPSSQPMSSFTPTNTTPAPVQNLTSPPTSTSTPSPALSSISAQPQSMTNSSTSTSTSSATSSASPIPPGDVSQSFSVPTPVAVPLPAQASTSSHSLPPRASQVQMPLSPNRYLNDNLGLWPFAPTQPGGPIPAGLPPNLIPASLLANPAAFPFLANLSASYAQTFGAIGLSAQPSPNVAGMTVPDGSNRAGQSTPTTTVPPNVPLSPTSVPPVLSAFVGHQES